MMGEIQRALYGFWSSFGVEAYYEGRVPVKDYKEDGTIIPIDPPYITFDAHSGETFAADTLVAISWHMAKNGANVQRERADMLDRIARAIPPAGRRIDLESGGYLMLYRGPSFQSFYDDPEDRSVIGGRTSCVVIYYTL